MHFKIIPEIMGISISVFDTVWAQKFHNSNKNELLHVLSGYTELTFENGLRFPAKEGDTLLIPYDTFHKDMFDFEDDLKILLISFEWEHIDEFCAKVDNSKINRIRQEARTEIRWIFEHMRSDRGGTETDRVLENSRLMNLLMLIYREVNRTEEPEITNGNRDKLMNAARRYIERNYAMSLRLEDIAVHLKVSPFHLSRIFSKESDFTLFEYLTEVRINEAKKLLRDNRLLISEVAELTGYDNGNYFAKVFRSRVGCTPGQYRASEQ